jgi:5-(carboxyamino)imidazole ribonucleotide synthase
MTVVPPGSTLGILGGGQLGRMAAMAAARLGYRVHVFTPEADAPAADVAARATVADFADTDALDAFAAAVDAVTLEWENVPVAAIERLAGRVPVRPGAGVLAVTQDRIAEKAFAGRLGLGTAPWRGAATAAEAAAAVAELGTPCILKTTRLGYDGRGQARVRPGDDMAAAWARIGAPDRAIVEGVVDFACEVSVVLARGIDGAVAAYPAVENRHRDQILSETRAPAGVPPATAAAADGAARALAEALGVVGILAVEFFVTRDGGVLVNEMAPRPHNSGHWTLDACPASQFEQQVRSACGLPLGDPTPFAGAVMRNLLGHDADRWADHLADPGARLHLYGKREARPGRKMGHVTHLLPLPPVGG